MGLDVGLRRCPNWTAALAKQDEYERRSNAAWHFGGKKYEELTKEDKAQAKAACATIQAELGTGEYGEDPSIEVVERDHPDYPDHLFKLGYFRSSYNDSGINSKLTRLSIPNLDAIFSPGEDYYVAPRWDLALVEAEEVLSRITAEMEKPFSRLDALGANRIDTNWTTPVTTAKDALALAISHLKEKHSFGEYSNAYGEFFPKPIRVHAVIPSSGGWHSVFIVYEAGGENGEHPLEWYRQAMVIVRDTIKLVLASDAPDEFRLSWSG